MNYRIEWEQDAVDALERLDAPIIQRILLRISWLSTNLDNIKSRLLTRNLRGYFKLRVGDYRVIYTVDRKYRVLVIEDVGHRRDIYRMK